MGVRWERCMCTQRKTCSIYIRSEYRKTIYLIQVTPRSPCGTILFGTKPIFYKRMRRLVGVRALFILGG